MYGTWLIGVTTPKLNRYLRKGFFCIVQLIKIPPTIRGPSSIRPPCAASRSANPFFAGFAAIHFFFSKILDRFSIKLKFYFITHKAADYSQ